MKSAYFATLSPEQAEGLEDEKDEQIVEGACVEAAGFLVALAAAARDRMKVLDEHV